MKLGKIKQCPNSRTDICIRVSRWRRIVDSLLNRLTLRRKLLRAWRVPRTGAGIRRLRTLRLLISAYLCGSLSRAKKMNTIKAPRQSRYEPCTEGLSLTLLQPSTYAADTSSLKSIRTAERSRMFQRKSNVQSAKKYTTERIYSLGCSLL